MADAIDNLIQDLNQSNAVDEFPGYPGYKMGDLVPNMGGVRIGDVFYGYDASGQQAPYNWRTGNFEFQPAPTGLGAGSGIDFNIRDQPVERINIGIGDEQNAFIPGGVYTPGNQQQYITGGNVLVPPGNLGGTIGVVDVNPADFAGQKPSVPEGIVSGGQTVGRTFKETADYSVPIGFMDNGDIIMANRNNIRDTIIVPSGRSISESEMERGFRPDVTIPTNWNQGISTSPSTSQAVPTSVGAIESTPTGAGFDLGSEGALDLPGGGAGMTTGPIDITPGWKQESKDKEEKTTPPFAVVDPNAINPYVDPRTGEEFPPDQNGNRWNFIKGEWDMAKPPGEGTGGTTTPPAGGGTGTTTKPPTGGGTTTPGTGGTRPATGGGTTRPGTGGGGFIPGTGGLTGGTPFGESQQVIPTKPLRQIPIPDRQADPFEKLYADLLANAQQQNQYRYINYDPDAIMNAAMRAFRGRSAMRSLQG